MAAFHWLDYVLFAGLLILSLGLGIYAALSGGKQRTTSEFLVGDRQLGLVPVTFSIFMSFISAILILGNVAEMYLYGAQFVVQGVGSALAFIASAYVMVPVFYPLRLTSSFKYLMMRYNSSHPKLVGDVLLIITLLLYMGLAIYAPSTALEGATGFPVWLAIIISGVVATVYTSIGGMKAVVWTDSLQGVVYLVGIIVVLIIGCWKVGGIGEVFRISSEQGRFGAWNFSLNPYSGRLSFWSCLFGSMVASFGMVTSQTSMQRFSALKTLREAKLSILLLSPAVVLMYLLTGLLGLVVFTHFHIKGCDPLRSGEINNPNQLVALFIMEEVNYPGLPGVFLSVLFAGALSTLSSAISALAAVTWKDILEPCLPPMSEFHKTLTTKLLSIMYGVLATCMAFAFQYVGGHVMQMSHTLVVGSAGPLLGIFLVALFFPWTNSKGVCVAAVMSLGLTMWLAIGQSISKPHKSHLPTNVANCTGNVSPLQSDAEDVFILYRMSFYWFAAVGTSLTVLLSLIISFLTGPTRGADIDPDLMTPIIDHVMPCLPLRMRRTLWCGVRYDQRKLASIDQKVDPAAGMKATTKQENSNGNGVVNKTFTTEEEVSRL